MEFKKGDKVRSTDPQFKAMWLDKNVWVVNDVRHGIGNHKVLYACFNKYDSGKTIYHFRENDVERI